MKAEAPALRSRSGYIESAIHDLIEAQVERTPEALALISGETRLAYRDLNDRANALAWELRARGVVPESIVAILAESSIESVIGVLAILKAGGAYLALSAADPDTRLEAILQASGTRLVLTTPRFRSRIHGAVVVDLERTLEPTGNGPVPNIRSGAGPDTMAFVRYTSGSSGTPKGVVNTHRSIANRLAAVPLPDIQPADICAVNTSMGFGSRLFFPLALGATVVVLGDEEFRDPVRLVRAIQRHSVTAIYMVPSLLGPLLDAASRVSGAPTSLRAVTVGGEILTGDRIAQFREVLPDARLIQLYGSNEIGSAATIRVVTDDRSADWRSIGRPVVNTRIHILDESMQPVPAGATGEICVSSRHLARGYLNDPELTRERFVPDPFDPAGEQRMYRTGDLGRYLPNGEIAFAGRADRQVKIRGYRVELAEVEAALVADDRIAEAIVVDTVDEGHPRLAAHVVARPGVPPSPAELRRRLQERLPSYMVPASIQLVDAIPRTPTGKIDRRALVQAETGLARSRKTPASDVPRTATEERLAAIWAEVLGTERVGVETGFFDLGGDSLMAMHVVLRVAEAFGRELSIVDLSENPTVRALSRKLDAVQDANVPTAGIEPLPPGETPPLSILQEGRLRDELGFELRGRNYVQGRARLGLDLEGTLDVGILEEAVNAVIERHAILRTGFWPETSMGPFSLRGWRDVGGLFRDGRNPLKLGIRFGRTLHDEAPLTVPVIDLETVDPRERDAEARRQTEEVLEEPFDYETPPLVRVVLLRFGPTHRRMIVAASHVVADGLSLAIFQREVEALYDAFVKGKVSPLPELPIQYGDFAAWEKRRCTDDRLERFSTHWHRQLAEFPPMDARALDFARPDAGMADDLDADRESRVLEPELVRSLRECARARHTTVYTLVVAAFAALLHQASGRERISLVAFVANRTRPETQNLIGWFANDRTIGLGVSDGTPVGQFLNEAKRAVIQATVEQEIPFLAANIYLSRQRRDTLKLPPARLRITCELRRQPSPTTVPRLRLTRVRLDTPRSEHPLGLLVYDGNPILITARYQTAVFESSAIRRMLERLRRALDRMVRSPEKSVADLCG